jgi:hypothetical protein
MAIFMKSLYETYKISERDREREEAKKPQGFNLGAK